MRPAELIVEWLIQEGLEASTLTSHIYVEGSKLAVAVYTPCGSVYCRPKHSYFGVAFANLADPDCFEKIKEIFEKSMGKNENVLAAILNSEFKPQRIKNLLYIMMIPARGDRWLV